MQNFNQSARAGSFPDDASFYGRLQDQQASELQTEEVADDPQLRADLARSLRVVASLSSNHQTQPHDEAQAHQHDPGTYLSPQDPSLDQISASDVHHSHDGGSKIRQKTSKACDECRRKKIRCNTTDEPDAGPCSHCKRTGVSCAFSRQQMKRGPSKGYIKELAERLHTLEHQVQPSQLQQTNAEVQSILQQLANEGHHIPSASRPAISNAAPNSQPQLAGYKRTHDGFEVPQAPDSQQNSTLNFAYRELFGDMMFSSQIDPALSTPQCLDPPTTVQTTFSESAISAPSFFRPGADLGRLQNLSIPYESGRTAPVSFQEWDDQVVDEYYRLIHKTFPLLPHSRIRLCSRLSDCPSTLREAFLTALSCLMRTFPSSTLRPSPEYSTNIKRAAELLASYPFDSPATHTSGTNLVYLQTLILMALESDNHGPATVRGQAGPSRAEWLGRAAGVAGQSEINLMRPRERFPTEGDPDSDERIARRVWWSLFILDRWHASSTADLLKLPENSGVLLPDDQILLGESTYHLARLSFIIGHFSAILTTTRTPSTNVMSPANPASQLLGLTLAGEIDRFRESVESVWGSLNLVHLSYHHSHLLIKRLNPTTEPTDIIDHALKVATVLNQRQTPITPLNHHFGALSAMTLCELADNPRTARDAKRGLTQLAEALGMGRGLAGHPSDSTGWDNAVRILVAQKLAKIEDGSSSAASADSSGVNGRGESAVFDSTELIKYGYLTALGQGRLGF